MKKILYILTLFVAFFSLDAISQGQVTTQGKEFYVAFGKNFTHEASSSSLDLQIRIVATNAATVTLTFTELGTSEVVNIAEGSVYTRPLTTTEKKAVYSSVTGKNSKSLHISSNEYISVFALNQAQASTDATNVLPINNLGTSYFHLSYKSIGGTGDGYTLIGSEDNTQVYENGILLTTLNRGEVYSYYVSSSDLTGTHITSDKPIAYFTTNSCVNIPIGYTACDCLYQQLASESTWGSTFLVPVTSQGVERIRVLASQNGTTITYQGGTLRTDIGKGSLSLNAGEFAEIEVRTVDKGCYIVADKPVAVGSFLTGVDYVVGSLGDPAFAWVPPVEQTVGQVAIAPFIPSGTTNLTNHYALIVAKTLDKNETKMGIGADPNSDLVGGTWIDHPSGYSFYSFQMTSRTDTYTFANPGGLTVMGYGVGNVESYYYLAASSSRKLDAYYSINDTHYQDYNGQVFCNGTAGPYAIKGVVQYPISGNPGDIRWLINGVEEVSAQDQLAWTLNSITPNIPVTITMRVKNNVGEVEDLSTTFTVSSINRPVITPSGTQLFSNGEQVMLTSTLADEYQWYLNGTAIAGATSHTYNASVEGIYTIITKNLAGCVSEASVPVMVKLYPDNISEADCFSDVPQTSFLPIEKNESNHNVHYLAQPFVGELDEYGSIDGKLEIVTTNHGATVGYSEAILVFDQDLKLKKTITTEFPMRATTTTPLALVRINPTDKYALIIAACYNDYSLYAYTTEGENGTKVWKSNASYYNVSTKMDKVQTTISPVIGDINNDGYPEILAGDRIFDAETGILLVELPDGGRGYRSLNSEGDITGNNLTSMPVLADIDNDGYLEVVGGNTTYKINITNRTGTTGNTATVLATAAAGKDGFTSVADIDLDGQLDVIVSYQTGTVAAGNRYPAIMVWNGATGDIIGGPTMPTDIGGGASRVFIGNMDNSYKYPEMAFSYVNKLVAFSYDPTGLTNTTKLVQKWITTTSDGSGATTLSMFDFDQDNNTELVYRDETHLRIMDGVTGTNKETFVCHSATHSEYPIIVDIDKDGHADIIVSGSNTLEDRITNIRLKRYSGTNNDWAPARTVWNQHGYNSVHIKEDLTVPRFQLNPSTIFPGKDKILGTSDDVRPYNGFLLQQTVLNRDGYPLFLTPNVQIVNSDQIAYEYDSETDRLTIKNLELTNKGDATLNAPIMVSIYKDAINSGNLITTHQEPASIAKGETITITFEIEGFGKHIPTDKLIISINDDGTGKTNQPVCEECEPNNSNSFANLDISSLAWAEPYRNCIGGTVQFKSAALNAVAYEWIHPDGMQLAATKDASKANLALTDGGQYTFKAIGVNGDLSLSYKLPHLSVAPYAMYWKQNAIDNNWNNLDNWAADVNGTELITKAVPAPCTSVHIPGKSDFYPALDGNTLTDVYGLAACENITFEYGAQLAYQHKLQYKKAYIRYNWGYYNDFSGVAYGTQPANNAEGLSAPVKKRDKWYALAAPLKNMATGDFSFAGYPLTWQAGFALSNPHTGIKGGQVEVGDFGKVFPTNDVPISETNNAIAVKVSSYQSPLGYNDHRNLEGLKGIVEIPYFENNAKSIYYPGHVYDRFTQVSKFFYFNPKTLQLLHSPVGHMKRGDEAYRFIYEEGGIVPNITVNGTPTVVPGYEQKVKRQSSTSLKVMIGNPFMAPISAKRFFEVNSDKLLESDGYLLFDSDAQTWKSYNNVLANVGDIPPLQAFIVTLKNEEENLLFPLEGTYALTRGAALKSTSSDWNGDSRLYLKSIDNTGFVGDYSVLVTADANENIANIKKMIYPEGHATSETFFIDPYNKDYNLIQAYEKGVREIGIAVKSSDMKNTLSLTFENVDEFFSTSNLHPILFDRHLRIRQNLISNSTYAFTQRHVTSENKYIDSDRFVLQLLSPDDELMQEQEISIVYMDKQLEVKANQIIDKIQIYDMLGRQVYSESNLNTVYYTKSLSLNQGVYIVKVYTESGEIKVGKIMAL
ncbi:T9SS sorting signal type C domain-containing protein [Dysgonomonas sp. Marseille-P4677]|uniref:T9SS sorting signal type C domain-containing protein n=1 Tax=Dysgonomonas sp. Marseille-P4677 TaxID=2364790 RepID=UPI001912CD73|nr:T9SS sorting signal type C domain-containing protein [Dysgonomonas sp. Marseille-P4677]MBK5719723.1 T9SS sorting signal type C domain-containing protein [Dysgonomonas sp. Marseille-P4677]